MDSKAIDAVDFREAQHKHWTLLRWGGWSGASSMTARTGTSASGWWSSLACGRGAGVLDVAAGYGEPALTAARKAGPEGRCCGDGHLGRDARVRA